LHPHDRDRLTRSIAEPATVASGAQRARLCGTQHREVHRVGDERAWWKQAGIDPIKVARQLWRKTRLNERAMRREPVTGPTALATALRFDGANTKAQA
jgi:hypothetical protein